MLRLGFIGCGGIARHHAKTIVSEVQDIEIRAGADVSPRSIELFGEVVENAAMYPDYGDLLKNADIDAVCVALPTAMHRDAVIAAAEAGKQVFCEKPMARSLRECDEMIEACAKAGVMLMIGQVRRYDTDWGTWREIVESGEIGRPVVWRQTSGGPAPGAWFMDDAAGGGPFLDGCVHNFDFANLVFGEPGLAIGSLRTMAQTSAPDTGTVCVVYESGDEVSLSWSWGLPPGVRAGGSTDIIGPKGAVLFPGSYDESELPVGFDRETEGAYLVKTESGTRVARFVKRNMFAEEWRDFRDAVTDGRSPIATGEIGKRGVEVALGAIQAGKHRKPVSFNNRGMK